ncbi:hypothetical protein BCR34DRAFT_571551 [Clohesyomyces aquaticus]|uniref:LysM domain-containing protein n=1 Tax=Clohesyomyces aquaticus TaxID=1231657 RepID=A0A1Y1Z793_9PLEO|nr:hypothetical protein BCR34DRAFT_571551 [Clohesyomyces aquaticus]
MGRWADRDGDAERLPEGMQRIGYDADTQTYTYQDAEGRIWEGDEGNRYGQLHPAGQRRPSATPSEIAVHNEELKRSNRESVRMMLPFALLIIVTLFLLFKFINHGTSPADAKTQVHCAEGDHPIQIQKGDTCWDIAKVHRVGLEELQFMEGNHDVMCERLKVGSWICVPDEGRHRVYGEGEPRIG